MLQANRWIAALLGAGLLAGCGAGARKAAEWPLPNGDLSSTRSLPASGIDPADVGGLHVAWRFRFRSAPGPSGVVTATPVVANGVVFVQDLSSTVYALDLRSGRLLWRRRFVYAQNPGPNGVAVAGGEVFGATANSAFALSARTGKVLWKRFLATVGAPIVDTAPQVAGGLVYTSTIGLPPDGKGILYALDAATGAVRWKLSTVKGAWAVPREAGGGGAWYPPSVAGGEVYWGTANPYPYGGTDAHPNGGAYAGAALYTDSLLVLDAVSGKLEWYDQVTPHDVRDHDFQLSPILVEAAGKELAIGAGKGGEVIAWNRATRRRVWAVPVGVHRNDSGPLPARLVPVCPGLLGGVETPMADDGTHVYVPVVDLCVEGSAHGYVKLATVDVAKGTGELVALDNTTGRTAWTTHLPQPDFGCATAADGVVFTVTVDGTVYAFAASDGAQLWSLKLPAGVNACPSLAGDTLLVAAGIPGRKGGVTELAALSTR
jgi:alcohol dehydrogenase (cytochrome c)